MIQTQKGPRVWRVMADDAILATELIERENAWWRDLRDGDWEVARQFMCDDFSITTAG